MKLLVSFLKQLQLKKVLALCVIGLTLFFTVACSNGTPQGARPQNPSVQAGGQNNPHKGGGDGYTVYKQSPLIDPGPASHR